MIPHCLQGLSGVKIDANGQPFLVLPPSSYKSCQPPASLDLDGDPHPLEAFFAGNHRPNPAPLARREASSAAADFTIFRHNT